MSDSDPVSERFASLSPHLDERGRGLFAATEARSAGYGGIAMVSRVTGRDGVPRHRNSRQHDRARSEGRALGGGPVYARVTRDDETLIVRENESVYLPLGCVHQLANPGKIPLTLLELQSGAYLGEDDIVRLEDS